MASVGFTFASLLVLVAAVVVVDVGVTSRWKERGGCSGGPLGFGVGCDDEPGGMR